MMDTVTGQPPTTASFWSFSQSQRMHIAGHGEIRAHQIEKPWSTSYSRIQQRLSILPPCPSRHLFSAPSNVTG